MRRATLDEKSSHGMGGNPKDSPDQSCKPERITDLYDRLRADHRLIIPSYALRLK